MKKVNGKALRLLKENITVSNWRCTSMGSGYEFRLKDPFAGKYDIWNSILSERLFLDTYEGMDEQDCEPTELEREEHFREYQGDVYSYGYETFLKGAIEKYIHLFEECVKSNF